MTPDPLTPSPDSPTPRTDAAENNRYHEGYVESGFARTLELERDRLDELQGQFYAEIIKLRRENAALVKEREELLIKKGGEEPCRDMNEPQEASAIAETPSAQCLSSNAAPTSDPLEAAALRALNFKLRAALAERDRGVIGAQLFTQLVDLRSQLQERDRELRELHTKDRVRTTEYNILTQENRDLRSQLQAVMATLENTRSAHLQAEQEVDDLSGDVRELESQLQAAKEEIEKLKDAYRDARNAGKLIEDDLSAKLQAATERAEEAEKHHHEYVNAALGKILALEAYVGELREALKECHPARVWDTARMYYTKEARTHISTETEWHDRRCRQVNAALSSQPDLTLIEEVRATGLDMAKAFVCVHARMDPPPAEYVMVKPYIEAALAAWRKLLARLNPAK